MDEQEEEVGSILSSRQNKMWGYYANPKSTSFGNARASSIRAGYTEYYANSITNKPWFKAKKRRLGMLNKAEVVLESTLVMDTTDGDGKEQADLLRVKADVAKFIAKTQGKDEGYSERTEVTGKNGDGIVFMPVELMEKYNLDSKEDLTNKE